MNRVWVLGAVLACCAGCLTETELVPAPWVPHAAGRPDVGTEALSGVQVFVRGDAWRGDPSELYSLVTPVQVTVVNHSGHPLRIRYREFALIGARGFQYAALPPFALQGEAVSSEEPGTPMVEPVVAVHPATPVRPMAPVRPAPPVRTVRPVYPSDRFFVAPRIGAFYAFGPPFWPYAFPYDYPYYQDWYGAWPHPLPTQDMLQQALPEGVLQDGGSVGGFVYFQALTHREQQVTFQMDLADAGSGANFGRVAIPMVAAQVRQ